MVATLTASGVVVKFCLGECLPSVFLEVELPSILHLVSLEVCCELPSGV